MDDLLANPNNRARFFAFVDVTPGGCWRYSGSHDTGGYGMFWFEGKHHKAHRLSYRHFVGEINDGLDVCHSCDVRDCIRPDHLWTGTRLENMQDASRKCRSANARLTMNEVREIRQLYEAGGVSQRSLARQYGVGQQTISRIVRRERWLFE